LAGGVDDDAFSILVEGENDLESGVEGWSGPEGANENNAAPDFFSVGCGADADPPKLKEKALAGVSVFFSSFLSSVALSSGLSARTSSTIFVTAAEVFFGVSAGFAPKLKGEGAVLDPDAGSEGVKPRPADDEEAVVAVDWPPNEKPPDGAEGKENPPAGGAGMEKPDFFGSSAFFGSAWTETSVGFHPALSEASFRCLLYCSTNPGRTSPRFLKASFSSVVVRKERMDVFSPRIEV